MILTPNGVLCRCCLPCEIVLQAVIVWVCDVMWFVFRERRRWGKNGIQVFHIGIDPFRAGGKRRETSSLKWVYLRLFADQKDLVLDANGWDLRIQIKSARQLCYQASFRDTKFKCIFINWSTFHLISGKQSFVLVFTVPLFLWFSFSLRIISVELQIIVVNYIAKCNKMLILQSIKCQKWGRISRYVTMFQSPKCLLF